VKTSTAKAALARPFPSLGSLSVLGPLNLCNSPAFSADDGEDVVAVTDFGDQQCFRSPKNLGKKPQKRKKKEKKREKNGKKAKITKNFS